MPLRDTIIALLTEWEEILTKPHLSLSSKANARTQFFYVLRITYARYIFKELQTTIDTPYTDESSLYNALCVFLQKCHTDQAYFFYTQDPNDPLLTRPTVALLDKLREYKKNTNSDTLPDPDQALVPHANAPINSYIFQKNITSSDGMQLLPVSILAPILNNVYGVLPPRTPAPTVSTDELRRLLAHSPQTRSIKAFLKSLNEIELKHPMGDAIYKLLRSLQRTVLSLREFKKNTYAQSNNFLTLSRETYENFDKERTAFLSFWRYSLSVEARSRYSALASENSQNTLENLVELLGWTVGQIHLQSKPRLSSTRRTHHENAVRANVAYFISDLDLNAFPSNERTLAIEILYAFSKDPERLYFPSRQTLVRFFQQQKIPLAQRRQWAMHVIEAPDLEEILNFLFIKFHDRPEYPKIVNFILKNAEELKRSDVQQEITRLELLTKKFTALLSACHQQFMPRAADTLQQEIMGSAQLLSLPLASSAGRDHIAPVPYKAALLYLEQRVTNAEALVDFLTMTNEAVWPSLNESELAMVNSAVRTSLPTSADVTLCISDLIKRKKTQKFSLFFECIITYYLLGDCTKIKYMATQYGHTLRRLALKHFPDLNIYLSRRDLRLFFINFTTWDEFEAFVHYSLTNSKSLPSIHFFLDQIVDRICEYLFDTLCWKPCAPTFTPTFVCDWVNLVNGLSFKKSQFVFSYLRVSRYFSTSEDRLKLLQAITSPSTLQALCDQWMPWFIAMFSVTMIDVLIDLLNHRLSMAQCEIVCAFLAKCMQGPEQNRFFMDQTLCLKISESLDSKRARATESLVQACQQLVCIQEPMATQPLTVEDFIKQMGTLKDPKEKVHFFEHMLPHLPKLLQNEEDYQSIKNLLLVEELDQTGPSLQELLDEQCKNFVVRRLRLDNSTKATAYWSFQPAIEKRAVAPSTINAMCTYVQQSSSTPYEFFARNLDDIRRQNPASPLHPGLQLMQTQATLQQAALSCPSPPPSPE